MSTSTLTPNTEQRVAWVTPPAEETFPAKVRAFFGRVRDTFGSVRDSAWAFAFQPEHLLAYETWSETQADSEE